MGGRLRAWENLDVVLAWVEEVLQGRAGWAHHWPLFLKSTLVIWELGSSTIWFLNFIVYMQVFAYEWLGTCLSEASKHTVLYSQQWTRRNWVLFYYSFPIEDIQWPSSNGSNTEILNGWSICLYQKWVWTMCSVSSRMFFLTFKFLNYFNYVSVCRYLQAKAGARGGRGSQILLELGFQTVASHLTWLLGSS